MIRFNFKNGTDDAFATYAFLNQTGDDVPLSVFIDAVAVSIFSVTRSLDAPELNSWDSQPSAVNTTATWCNVCQNSQDRGCGALTLAAEQARSAALSPISIVGAGFLGAGLTLAVVVLTFATLAFLGLLSFGKKPKKWRLPADDDGVCFSQE